MPEYDLSMAMNGKVKKLGIVPSPNAREAAYELTHRISPKARNVLILVEKVSDDEVEE